MTEHHDHPLNLATAVDNLPIDPSLATATALLPTTTTTTTSTTADHDPQDQDNNNNNQMVVDDDDDLFLPENPADEQRIEQALAVASEAARRDQDEKHLANGGGEEARTGDEHNPTHSPTTHVAPFSRPHRDEKTPHPEHIVFTNRGEFEGWLDGESSWCHFVQRRTTTPEKRAEERMKARVKAHEKALAAMAPEEAASAPPLKKRRRVRTSPVQEKVTYTCHHAGSYSSKHSNTLPAEKLRMNTKKSVKCNCNSRIVLTEMQDGVCNIVYFWRHDGHDPYAGDELESGRLPKVIDDWLIRQIEAGKDTEAIRRALQISEEEKQKYLDQATDDPASLDPDLPPPLAFTMKIRYPDIYNRYRKLKGPVKAGKPPKARSRGGKESSQPLLLDSVLQPALDAAAAASGSSDNKPFVPNFTQNGLVEVSNGVADADIHPDLLSGELARLAEQGHSDLAEALLKLPRGVQGMGEGDGDGDGEGEGEGSGAAMLDEEEMMRMARMAAGEVDGGGGVEGDVQVQVQVEQVKVVGGEGVTQHQGPSTHLVVEGEGEGDDGWPQIP